MRCARINFHSPLAEPIRRFIAHKRALNRRFDTEERALCLVDRYLVMQGINDIASVTPAVIDAFLAGRPRARPRSYNHLLGVLRRLFDWMVDQEMLDHSPVQLRPRRETMRRIPYLFDLPHARRLLDVAAALPDNNNARHRGATYAMTFALLYGLGLRVGEVARLTRADVDLGRRLLVIRETKFAKSRLVPFGPRMAERLTAYLGVKEGRFGVLPLAAPVFSLPRAAPYIPAPSARPSMHSCRTSGWSSRQVSRRRVCTTCGTASLSAPYCAGTETAPTQHRGCCIYPPFSATSTPPPRPFI